MDPRMIPRGQSAESQSNGAERPVGVYYHPEAKKFVETSGILRADGTMSYNTDEGRIQADSFVQLGFRPATEEEKAEYLASKKSEAKAEEPKPSSK